MYLQKILSRRHSISVAGNQKGICHSDRYRYSAVHLLQSSRIFSYQDQRHARLKNQYVAYTARAFPVEEEIRRSYLFFYGHKTPSKNTEGAKQALIKSKTIFSSNVN